MTINDTNTELLSEWKAIFQKGNEVYIYGAKKTAEHLICLVQDTDVQDNVQGCVVTSMEGNPKELMGYPVIEITKLKNKDAIILVPQKGIYREEVFALLEKLGFHSAISASKFLELFFHTEEIDDEYMREMNRRISEIEQNRQDETKRELEELKKRIISYQRENQPDFGEVTIYQGFETIGISGQRPSLYRILKYGLHNILNKEQSVLDIGCNCGFLDMMLAGDVKSVLGIEYDVALVKIADLVKDYLHLKNCEFIQRDFNSWYQKNENHYNVIFSFAIHHWLNITSEVYVEELDRLLLPEGYLCFESHDLSFGKDDMYDECKKLFGRKGYARYTEGMIKDDGKSKREYIIYQKI